MRSFLLFLCKKLMPIAYAKYIGIKVGNNCRLINCNYSTEPYLITLGDHVSATNVYFETHDGGVWVFRDNNPELDIVKPITVGNNVFIGYGVLILPGVEIGNNVVIGARSVVTRNIPSNSVAVGVPCRVIKNIDDYKDKVTSVGDNTKNMSSFNKKKFYLNKYSLKKID
jgi:acetyltransferase-like isoleucine patch superfamily enzyme